MTDRPTNHSTPEDDLFEFAANPVNPTNDLERTVQQVHRALNADTTAMPASIRQQIREELMPSSIARSIGFTTSVSSAQTDALFSPTRRVDAPRSRFMESVSRWQPVVSMTIVIALLASVIAITYERGVLNQPPSPNDVLPGFAQPATPENADAFLPECVPQENSSRSNDELLSADFLEFPIPAYSVAMAFPAEYQPNLPEVSANFWTCWANFRWTDPADTASHPMYTYLSERLRYVLLNDDILISGNTYLDRNPIPTIIKYYPLPLNVGHVYIPGEPVDLYQGEMFGERDLYWLPNDRWSAVIGSVSSHMLQTGQPVTSNDGQLMYISFIQEDQAWVVDEFFMICPSDFAASLTETPDYGSYDPAEILRGSDTCA